MKNIIFALVISLLIAPCHAFDAGDGGISESASAAAIAVETARAVAAETVLDNNKVYRAGDTMTGQLTLSGSSLTVSGGTEVNGIFRSKSQSYFTDTLYMSASGALGLITWDANNLVIKAGVNKSLSLGSNNISGALYISSYSYVGIGTATPNVPLMVIGSVTVTEMVTASSFNVTGSAYLVNGEKVIDGSRNIYATSLRVSTVADCSVYTPDSYGQHCTEADSLHPLWVATSTTLGGFAAVELHETNDSEGYASLYIASATAVATTVSVSSTPYTIKGTYVAGANLHNFTVTGSSFVYTGDNPHLFRVSVDVTVRALKDIQFAVSFMKNGVALNIPHMTSTGSKDNFGFNISNSVLISLTKNDTVSFTICNKTSTDDPTVYLNANIFQVD